MNTSKVAVVELSVKGGRPAHIGDEALSPHTAVFLAV